MSKVYSKYINNEDHNWYDSSNIVYSVCFDIQTSPTKELKIVFKGGRTYLYRNVEPMDYIMFRDATSQGKEFNSRIKNYECVKLDDTDISKLDSMRQKFMLLDESKEFNITMELNNETGEFKIRLNGEYVFEGVEGSVSVINLFKSLGIQYSYELSDCKNRTVDDFEKDGIINY